MAVRIVAVAWCLTCLGSALVGCQKPDTPLPQPDIQKDYDRPLPPGQFALRKLDPSMYPSFGDAWYMAKRMGLRQAVQYSLDYLHKPSSQTCFPVGPITHQRVMDTLELFLDSLDHADSPEMLDDLIRQNFDVYISVGCDDAGTVLFTGYYTPIFEGSLERTGRFRYPLYGLPPGFEKNDVGDPVGGPWYTRGEIEREDLLAGNEIVWLGDRFEAYVISVQGSGFIRLPDGSLHEVGYAGHNGHEYTSIRRMMVADGVIDRYKVSLDTMIRYFKDHPGDLDIYLPQNKRYIFFQDTTGGPFGCLGQPVTKYHSIATDKDIFPRACLAFVDTKIPHEPGRSWRKWRCFALDQDRGAAIRAPGRCDIYMGVGEQAGKMAGYTLSEGRLYYLLAKEGTASAPVTEISAPNATDVERQP
ncbi:MAG: MltA domain-containing protein [Phycisphaerae bacterium]|nr:MltA domain-containing protein [Phycisphaerae bacterium]